MFTPPTLKHFFPLFLLTASGAFAAEALNEPAPPAELAPIHVEDVRDRLERAGRVTDATQRTEVISARKMEKKQAKTLTEAVQNEPGVDAAVGCSICGMKRIQINGLKGEYTTVLVDGIPMHSTVSSYYGMDALATAGVARIEVARGAGASLLAPGALAGTLNVISEKAVKDGVYLDLSGGNKQYRAFSLVGTSVDDTGKRRSTIAAQHSMSGQFDTDNNGVNEAPRLGNYSLSARISQDLGSRDHLDFRLVGQRSDVFGGPMVEGVFMNALDTGNPTFQGDDVRQPYNGNQGATLEAIETERLEGTLKWTREHSEHLNTVWSLSGARQTQDSYYEGNDYRNHNDTAYSDVRANWNASEHHLLTIGGDARYEILRSKSRAYFEAQGRPTDDFDFFSGGGYVQDVWTPYANLEVSSAIRLDHLTVNWRGQTVQDNEVNQFVLVPRIHTRLAHGEFWTSRLAIGEGYRAPLTFFESEHGILDDGFEIAVTGIEHSESVVYSLTFDNRRTTSTLSAGWNHLRNMAFIDMTGTVPTLRNHSGNFSLFNFDAIVGYQLTDSVLLGASYEHFWYPLQYQKLLPFAAIEDRVKLLVDYEAGPWTWNVTANVVGPRDLRRYNYENRFNVFTAGVGSQPKLLDAPMFMTMDAKLSYQVDKEISVYIGVKNLLDYTQAKKENPLFWDASGEYDVIHVWGPLRGREVYAGLTARL